MPSVTNNISGVRQIVVGADFNCAKITQQDNIGPQVKCWGKGIVESSGICYPYIQTRVPVCNGEDTLVDASANPLSDLADVEWITAGRDHACAARKCEGSLAREVVCWGDDSKGQLGRGGTIRERHDSAQPVIASFDSGDSEKYKPLLTDEEHQKSLNANKDLTCNHCSDYE